MNRQRKPRYRRTALAKKAKQSISPLPAGEYEAEISELLSDGRGLARVDGKTVMIAEALPGERVRFRYTQHKRQFYSGQTNAVIKPSAARVKPRCEYVGRCGGCALQHIDADVQIQFKEQQLLAELQKQANISPNHVAPALRGADWGYRHRARLGLQMHDGHLRIGFRERGSKQLTAIHHCAVLVSGLSALIPTIAAMVSGLSSPNDITHVDMIATPQTLAVCFRHVCSLTTADMARLTTFAKENHVRIYLQPDNDDSIVGLAHEKILSYPLTLTKPTAKTLTMGFLPKHFTQINQTVNQLMIAQALDWLALSPTDVVLDLFCGLGNFTLPIATRAEQVVGVEGSQSLVDWAKQNAKMNDLTNADFYRADLTQETRMMAWRRKYRYNKLIIDPPRAGAIDILPFIGEIKPQTIVYVSCHAATLARDIDVLVNDYGYRLDRVGVMDMFTHTAHVESMALLVKT